MSNGYIVVVYESIKDDNALKNYDSDAVIKFKQVLNKIINEKK